ncbi:MAG: hypothetical protein KGJ68_14100 [Gammaproteobacteria bacterium]|nr:hypothetical protein [Gammaproteobacteria bacterium]
MPENEFASLQERLLRGGIAPRRAERLLLELKTHAAALLEEETARGQAPEAAQAAARSRLGSDDEIVRKALEQPALKSWGARWPLIVCVLLPPAGLLAVSVGTLSALVALVAVSERVGERVTMLIAWLVLYGFPLLCAFLLVRYTVTRRLGLAWPLLGLLLMAALGAWSTFTVVWPQAGVQGRLSAGVGVSTGWLALMRFGARWAATVAVALALYVLQRRDIRAGTPR